MINEKENYLGLGSYATEIVNTLKKESKTSEHFAECVHPIIQLISSIKCCNERDLLCSKLLADTELFVHLWRKF